MYSATRVEHPAAAQWSSVTVMCCAPSDSTLKCWLSEKSHYLLRQDKTMIEAVIIVSLLSKKTRERV